MSDPIIEALIMTSGVILSAIIAGFFLIWSHQNKTYHAVNGRMDELLDLTKESARAKGRAEEIERAEEANEALDMRDENEA